MISFPTAEKHDRVVAYLCMSLVLCAAKVADSMKVNAVESIWLDIKQLVQVKGIH